MAIDYSINPYSAGAVVFDQRPSLQFAQNQIARQQAKETALDNYFRDLNKNVTPAGMRSQDVPSLLEKQKEWQQFYQTNKSAITNPKLDNGKAYSEYFARYQDQLGHIQGSKEAMKATDQVGKMRMNPQLSYVFDDPKIIDQIQSHEKPINDPTRQGINLATMAVPPKPWGVKENAQYNDYLTKGIPFSETIGKTENLPDFKTRTEIIKDYGIQGKRTIGQRSMDMYDADRDVRIKAKHLEDELANDPTRLEQLNNVFKGIYGRDMDGAKEALAAQDIINQDLKSRSYKEGEQKWAQTVASMALRHKYSQSDIMLRDALKDKSEGEQNDKMDELYDSLKVDALKNRATYKPAKGHPYDQYMIKATEGMKKLFAVPDAKGHLIHPDEIRFSKDFDTVTPIFYEHYVDKKTGARTSEIVKGADGRSEVVKDLSHPILEPEFKERWKKEIMGAGAYGKTLKGKGSPKQEVFKLNGKSYTRKQLNDMTYDDNEIAQYLKSGLITQ